MGETLALRAYDQALTNIRVIDALAAGLPQVFADGHQMQQVLLNLVINAEQAMLSANGRGVLGRSDTTAFEPTALADPRIRDLARRVTVRTDASMSPRSLDQPTARVRIALRDGRMLEAGTTVARGDAAAPVGDDEIVDKFLALTSPVLGDRRARDAVVAVRAADTVKDVRELTAILTTA